MALENFRLGRVCLHEIYKRNDEGAIVDPLSGRQLLQLDQRARAAFQSRVLAAFRSDAKCMEMDILHPVRGSIADRGASLLENGDADFVTNSFSFAERLAQAQGSRQIPGGIVAVFDGTVGHPARRFFAVMKAELQEAFLREANLQATYLENLFLSPKAKLYKIGFFDEVGGQGDQVDARFRATVFDSHLSATAREGAATYFHSGFLGLGIPDDAAHQVRRFFEETRTFISSTNIDQETKVDLFDSLYTYLKTDNSPTIQTGEFADRYMDDGLGQAYRAHMAAENIPNRFIQKDLSEVLGRLRMRRLRFPRKIILSGPPEAMTDLVEVEDLESDDGAAWTRITVRGQIERQE